MWHVARSFALAAAGLSALAGVARIILGPEHRDESRGKLAEYLMFSAVVWILAGLFAYSTGKMIYEHGLDDRATETVTATVTGCQPDGDDTPRCLYHWTAGGHAHNQYDEAEHLWPDGHQLAIRIDPAHPDDPAMVNPDYWAWGVGIAIGVLGVLGGVVTLVVLETEDEDD